MVDELCHQTYSALPPHLFPPHDMGVGKDEVGLANLPFRGGNGWLPGALRALVW